MLSLNPWDILWTIVNLLVLYAIFRKFLFQPVMNIIHEREDMINKQFEDAQKQQDDAAQMKSEYENQLKGAREKADQIILDAKTRAQEEYNNKMEATRVEADHMLEKAKSDIANEQEKALYRLSVSREDVEKAEKLFFMTPQLQKVLTSPVVPAAKKYEIIDQVFALETTEDVLVRYMKIMCRIGNMTEMQDIFQYYYKYWDQMHHVVRADLIYAETPSKEEEAEAKKILDKNYPDSEITLTQSVDESLIGGYVVKVGYKEYDHSYEGRLRQLQRKLTGR